MKRFLLAFVLLLGLGTVQAAQAQAALANLIGAGLGLGIRSIAGRKQPAKAVAADQAALDKAAASNATAAIAAGPKELVMQRTSTDKLPKKGAEQITALEAQLDRCHAAMLADPKAIICSPEQRTTIQSAAVSVARVQSGWSLQPYQQEMAFYQAEDARRQQAAAAATPAK